MSFAAVLVLIVAMGVVGFLIVDVACQWRKLADEQEHSGFNRRSALRAPY